MKTNWSSHFDLAFRAFERGFRCANAGFRAAAAAPSPPPPPPGEYRFTATTWRQRWRMASTLRALAWRILFTGSGVIRIKPRQNGGDTEAR